MPVDRTPPSASTKPSRLGRRRQVVGLEARARRLGVSPHGVTVLDAWCLVMSTIGLDQSKELTAMPPPQHHQEVDISLDPNGDAHEYVPEPRDSEPEEWTVWRVVDSAWELWFTTNNFQEMNSALTQVLEAGDSVSVIAHQ